MHSTTTSLPLHTISECERRLCRCLYWSKELRTLRTEDALHSEYPCFSCTHSHSFISCSSTSLLCYHSCGRTMSTTHYFPLHSSFWARRLQQWQTRVGLTRPEPRRHQ